MTQQQHAIKCSGEYVIDPPGIDGDAKQDPTFARQCVDRDAATCPEWQQHGPLPHNGRCSVPTCSVFTLIELRGL